MVCKAFLALCIVTAGLRVRSLPSSAPSPVSLPAHTLPPTARWTSSARGAPASPTSGAPSTTVLPVPASGPAPTLPKNTSTEPGEEQPRSPASPWEGASTEPSPARGGVHLTPTPWEHSSSTPGGASAPPTGSQAPSEAPAGSPPLPSPQAPASSPPPPPPPPPTPSAEGVSAASAAGANHSSAEPSTDPAGAPTPPPSPAEEPGPAHAPTSPAPAEPGPADETPQATGPPEGTCLMGDLETTASPAVIMQEVEHALSSGSIAAITVTVIAVVLLVFGVAAYLKIRHSSYGRLLDDHDYGSWGNYNNPLYDDS